MQQGGKGGLMKMPVTVGNGFVLTAMLLPLMLLVGCKQADTHAQMQMANKAGSADVSAKKAGADVPEEKKIPLSSAEPKPVSAEIVTKQEQKTGDKAFDAKVLPATAAGSPPAAKRLAEKAKKPAKEIAAKQVSQKPKPAVPTFGPDDPRSGIYLSITGKIAGMGDPSRTASDAYKYGSGSHPKALAGAGLPKDKFGLIDWMAIVNKGIIKPRGSLKPGVPDLPPFDMNVLITSKGDFVNDVMFPHKAHTYWLKCENCHTGIFIMAKGKNRMTMQGIVEGKWCGRCHGKVAFPLTDCNRCHQTPKKAADVVAEK